MSSLGAEVKLTWESPMSLQGAEPPVDFLAVIFKVIGMKLHDEECL
jgi:hypothetical protein